MSKEYKMYRFFILIYVILIANFAVTISEGTSFYIWFCSSIFLLLILTIYEFEKIKDLFSNSSDYKIAREAIYLIFFIIAYPRHYQLSRGSNQEYVILLQLINILLFILVFCFEKKKLSMNK